MQSRDDQGAPQPIEQQDTARLPSAGPAPWASVATAAEIERLPTERIAATRVEERETERIAATRVEERETERIPAPALDQLDTARIPAAPEMPVDQIETRRITAAPASTLVDVAPPAHGATSQTPERPSALRRMGSGIRRRPKRALALLVALLLVAVAIPLLQFVAQVQTTSETVARATATATTGITPLPAGTRDPHAMDWVMTARQRAELEYVNNLIAHMTLDEKIGQMIMLGFLETDMSPALEQTIKDYHLGSVILYAWNIKSASQTRKLTHDMQAAADIPLLVATDQEGGPVNRLQAIDGYLPSAADIGARNDPNYAWQRGAFDGKELYRLGINLNLAPVVDVRTTDGGDLGGRAFGATPGAVTRLAGAYLQGLQSGNHVAGTLKHFPGLGDVPADPHKALYTFNRSAADLERIDWAPYKSLIATGQVYAVMSTHVVIPAIDPNRPASLSRPVLTGVLRDQLGFQGVIITDGIYMEALSAHYSFAQIVLYAVQAGNDIICSTYSIESTAETVRVLKQAVQDGTLSTARVDDSVRRILLLKLRFGVLSLPK